MRLSETTCRIGFEQLGDVPFGSIADMVRVAPDLVRLGGHRSVYALVSKFIKDERLRIVFSFHPLLIGGNPFTASAIYTLIPYLERRWGVHFAMGGTGAGGARAGRPDRRARAARSATMPRWTRSCVAGGRAPGRPAGIGRNDPGRHRGVQRRLPPGLTASCCRPRRAGAGPTASWTGRATRWACSCGISAPTGDTRTLPTTPSCLVRATANCCSDIFKRKVLADDFSLYLHRPTATDPSLAPPGCDAFYVLSPVPNLAWRRRTGGRRRNLTGRQSRRICRQPCCRIWSSMS